MSPRRRHATVHRGDKRKALDLYTKGQAIRKELQLDNLDVPPAFFAELQQHYPLALHSRSKAGEVVLVQQPGKLDVGKLKALGVERMDVVRYFMYHLEFCAQKIDPNAKVLMVVDFANLGFCSFFSGEFLGTIKTISDTIGTAFCRRVSRYVIVNPPGVLETVFQLISTLLPAGARDNCTIAKDAAALEVRRAFRSRD